jgi:hypothetical protein
MILRPPHSDEDSDEARFVTFGVIEEMRAACSAGDAAAPNPEGRRCSFAFHLWFKSPLAQIRCKGQNFQVMIACFTARPAMDYIFGSIELLFELAVVGVICFFVFAIARLLWRLGSR